MFSTSRSPAAFTREEPAFMPPGKWRKEFSKREQRHYYFNIENNKSSWEKPADYAEVSVGETKVLPSRPEICTKTEVPSMEMGSASILKRPRLELESQFSSTSNKIETQSYRPPVSGAAADLATSFAGLGSVSLPFPKIIAKLPPSAEDMWHRKDIQVNEYLASVYDKGWINDEKGTAQKFKDTTNPLQGRHLYNLIATNKFTRTAEVGLAMGASAVWMCQAHHDNHLGGSHVAIDPNQTSQYDNMGKTLVARCGLKDYLSVIEATSYRALPALFEEVLQNRRPRFHLIYIDGWHTFDYTLVDFFYADLLLEVNGVIVLDDIKHKPVQKSLRYFVSNFPHYRIVDETPCYVKENPGASSQATFIKIANDSRAWNAHVDF